MVFGSGVVGLSILTHTHTPPWLTSLWLGKMTANTHAGISLLHVCSKHPCFSNSRSPCSLLILMHCLHCLIYSHAQAPCGLVSRSLEKDWVRLYYHSCFFSHSVESGVPDPYLGFSVDFLSCTGLWVVVIHMGNWELFGLCRPRFPVGGHFMLKNCVRPM